MLDAVLWLSAATLGILGMASVHFGNEKLGLRLIAAAVVCAFVYSAGRFLYVILPVVVLALGWALRGDRGPAAEEQTSTGARAIVLALVASAGGLWLFWVLPSARESFRFRPFDAWPLPAGFEDALHDFTHHPEAIGILVVQLLAAAFLVALPRWTRRGQR